MAQRRTTLHRRLLLSPVGLAPLPRPQLQVHAWLDHTEFGATLAPAPT